MIFQCLNLNAFPIIEVQLYIFFIFYYVLVFWIRDYKPANHYVLEIYYDNKFGFSW